MKNNSEISFNDIWNGGKQEDLRKFIDSHVQKQTVEQVLRNNLLSIQYQFEDYLENNVTGKKDAGT
ncbi:MAG: hypothetical protein H7257_09475 [Taibaiella sp.]|nr:hypothetical protein [Taibaiella sp.]